MSQCYPELSSLQAGGSKHKSAEHNPSVQKPPIDAQGETPLHHAAELVWFGRAQSVLEAGAKVDARDNDGQTPLHKLAQISDRRIIERSPKLAAMLLAFGADPNATGNSGRTPLHLAAHNGHETMARFLIESGADLTVSDADGLTPADKAAR